MVLPSQPHDYRDGSKLRTLGYQGISVSSL